MEKVLWKEYSPQFTFFRVHLAHKDIAIQGKIYVLAQYCTISWLDAKRWCKFNQQYMCVRTTSWFFLFTSLGMDIDSEWNHWMDIVVSFSHLLCTVNSSLNFLIYCIKDEKFRSSFIILVSCCSWKKTQRHESIIIVWKSSNWICKMSQRL